MKTKKKPLKMTAISISSSELENHVALSSIHNDVINLINKYAGSKLNTSVYTDKLDSKEGFFLMWIKKDSNLPLGEQIQIHTLAQLINLEDVANSMEKTISDMIEEQKAPKNFA